jgi:hypothetical protein
MAIQNFNQPYETVWNTDAEGNPVSVLKENEAHTISDNSIMLAQIPDEFYKVAITGKYEVSLNAVLSSADYFKVDYRSGLVYFYNSLEATSVTIAQYRGRGVRNFIASRIKVEDIDNNYTASNLEDVLKEIAVRLTNLEP